MPLSSSAVVQHSLGGRGLSNVAAHLVPILQQALGTETKATGRCGRLGPDSLFRRRSTNPEFMGAHPWSTAGVSVLLFAKNRLLRQRAVHLLRHRGTSAPIAP
jgi:hypothetical protein